MIYQALYQKSNRHVLQSMLQYAKVIKVSKEPPIIRAAFLFGEVITLVFNINNKVKVKLTDKGKEIFYHQFDWINKQAGKELIKPHYPSVDDDGYTEFQMWGLMKLYGLHIQMGFDQPFETNIIICE
jgi:hypothetical protein